MSLDFDISHRKAIKILKKPMLVPRFWLEHNIGKRVILPPVVYRRACILPRKISTQ